MFYKHDYHRKLKIIIKSLMFYFLGNVFRVQCFICMFNATVAKFLGGRAESFVILEHDNVTENTELFFEEKLIP